MQNSKLSTIIIPKLNDSWQRFLQSVEIELNSVKASKKVDDERASRLANIIPKIKEAREESKEDISAIFKYRDLFVSIDSSLSSLFDALQFFKLQNNFDNDGVKIVYNKIFESPIVDGLSEEYNGLLIRENYVKEQIKPLEDILRGKKINTRLIETLLDNFNLDEKTRKDVLLYAILASSVKQNEVKKTTENAVDRKNEKAKLYRDKIKELITKYQSDKDSFKYIFDRCYEIKRKMSPDEVNMYKGYMAHPSEALEYGFDDEAMLKIYTLSLFKAKEDIEEYIEGISDIQMDSPNLSGEISFFQELIREFGEIGERISGLLKEDEIEEDSEYENTRVFFLHDPWQHLIPNTKLIAQNKKSINAFISKVNSSSSHTMDGVKVTQMLGVEEASKVLGKNILLTSNANYKMAYVTVDDCVLVLGIAEVYDTKFENVINGIVKGGSSVVKKQISEIEDEESRKEFIELNNELTSDLLSSGSQK